MPHPLRQIKMFGAGRIKTVANTRQFMIAICNLDFMKKLRLFHLSYSPVVTQNYNCIGTDLTQT